VPASVFRLLTFTFLFSLFLSQPALAGEVRGRIVDPDGRGVPGADVLLTIGASVHARAISDAEGRFVLSGPDRGDAVLRVALAGFRAEPLPVATGPSPRDVGTIALAISAVSEAVVVSAAQVEVPLSSTASSVTVLTGEELEGRQIESVADALRLVPGLNVVASGGRGAVTSVFPRGGESDYSLVFVDGVQINTFGGGLDFAHLPAVNIERIEIVRGPQSALYGSNAIGSVVRIVTRRGGPPSASASIEGGGGDTFRTAAATSGARGRWQWGGTAERLASDGQNGEATTRGETVANDDYERHTISGALGWRDDGGSSLRGDVRYSHDDRGFPGPFGSDPGGTYSGIDTVSRGRDDRWLLAAGAGVPVGATRLSAEITHARLDGEFVSPSFLDGSPTASESWTRRTSGRVQVDRAIVKDVDMTAGVEVLGERAGGTFITATGSRPVPVERGLAGFFGEARWSRASRLFVNAGLRVERITRHALDGDADAFTPRPPFDADTVVSANPKVSAAWFVRSGGGGFTRIRGAAGTGIRPPDAFEIAFTDNPSLEPERSRSVEAGVDHAFLDGLALVEATGFLNRFDDLIVATGSFTGSSQYRTDNISNARSAGLEIAATARRVLGASRTTLQARVGYTFLDTEILAVDSSGDAPPPFAPGDRLLRRPAHQFSLDFRVDSGRLSAFLQGGGRSRVVDVDPSFGTFGGLFDLAGYSSWNAGASWRLHRRLEIFGRVSNLFDRDYEEVLGFPALGRSAMAGLRVAAGR
jgi:outer membrane cobalamin receptor